MTTNTTLRAALAEIMTVCDGTTKAWHIAQSALALTQHDNEGEESLGLPPGRIEWGARTPGAVHRFIPDDPGAQAPADPVNGELVQLRAQNMLLLGLYDAVAKLVKAKGRFHTEQNYGAVVAHYDLVRTADSTPPASLPQGAEARDAIRAALNEYYDALTVRQHLGRVARERAFKKIEQAMGMSWEARKAEVAATQHPQGEKL